MAETGDGGRPQDHGATDRDARTGRMVPRLPARPVARMTSTGGGLVVAGQVGA